MQSALLADTILIVHTVYVGIVVFSVPLIILGGCFDWDWVRNPWFRYMHLLMIGIVVAEALLGARCPLTVWENAARAMIRQQDAEQDFIALWLDRLLFYHFSHLTFTLIYTGFGLIVAGLFWLVPIRRNRTYAARR